MPSQVEIFKMQSAYLNEVLKNCSADTLHLQNAFSLLIVLECVVLSMRDYNSNLVFEFAHKHRDVRNVVHEYSKAQHVLHKEMHPYFGSAPGRQGTSWVRACPGAPLVLDSTALRIVPLCATCLNLNKQGQDSAEMSTGQMHTYPHKLRNCTIGPEAS